MFYINLSSEKSKFKVACRVKIYTTWQQKTQIPILAKVKTNNLQGHKRYIKTFEINSK